MNPFAHIRILCAGLFLALAFSAALPISAFADDGNPPPTEPAPPADDGSAAIVDAAAPIESNEAAPTTDSDGAAIATEEPIVEEAAPEIVLDVVAPTELDAVETAIASNPVMAEIPEGTDVVVLDDQGEPVALASEEAADIISGADPIWCPATVATPVSGAMGCTTSQTSLAALITLLGATPPTVDGVIWIEKGYDSSVNDFLSSAFTLSPGTVGTMSNFKLTIKGGWNGLGTNTIDMNDPSLFVGDRLEILGWNNDVTLSDLEITLVPAGPALQVTTTKNIVLTRVTSQSNTAQGASLDNTSGTGNITITSSKFNNNSVGGGLNASSLGTITLSNVTANNNTGGYGAYLLNNGVPIGAKNVTLSGTSEFNSNNTEGLQILSKGLITIANITASYNGQGASSGSGAALNNLSSTTAQGVTLTGINIFLENLDYGLSVLSNGVISASNLYANSNVNENGAFLNNSGAATALAVNLSGTNQFKDNDNEGLRILSKGAVTLSNVTASLNGIDGVDINNTYFVGGIPAVNLTGTNVFLGNGSHGIEVLSLGPISMSSVTANNNAVGADLNNSISFAPQKVTVSGVNNFSDNGSWGLFVQSKGLITVNSVTANNTTANTGVYLLNNNGLDTSKQGITLTGTNVMNDNGVGGLAATSYGPITISNVTANNNLGGIGIHLYNSGAATPQLVTASGINAASGNFSVGFNAASKGAITVSNLTASQNGILATAGNGASLTNSTLGAVGAVTLTGTNVFNGNYESGLDISSNGAVSIANVTANTNMNWYGANINNLGSGTTTPQNVTLSGTNTFNGNRSNGLQVFTYGAITASNLRASSNGLVALNGRGAYLTNSGGTTPKAVTLTGTNFFDNNYFYGLQVTSIGPISLSSVTASNVVTGDGANINNGGTALPQNVTLSGTNTFNTNDDNGLTVISFGAITINNVTANGNGTDGTGNGVYLANSSSALPQKVAVTGTNVFSGNATIGIEVYSIGVISLSNTTASGNTGGDGALLFNAFAIATQGVTLTGTNVFESNSASGLIVSSYGPISLNSVTANGNFYQGANLTNFGSPGSQKVAITGTNSFSANISVGLTITSQGAITLNNVNASGSTTAAGANLQNHNLALPQLVTLTGTNSFSDNATWGIQILSQGVISVNSMTASDNLAGDGADLQNAFGVSSAAQGVKLTGTNAFNFNAGTGLDVISFGAISASNVTASGSATSDGAMLDNNSAAGVQGVTLTGINVFLSNAGHGLRITTHGAISLSNITATGNGTDTTGDGVYLVNNSSTPQNVTFSGVNVFNSNGDSGLEVRSKGVITISSITASGNMDYGAYLENIYGATNALKGVTLTGTNAFDSNTTNTGLTIFSYGPVSINNVSTYLNGNYGANISNTGAASPQKVALTGINTFSANASSGLNVNTKGAITSATSLTAGDNGANGAEFANTVGGAVGGVSLLGTNNFSNNLASGLVVNSVGAISLNNVTASLNGDAPSEYGATLDNTFAGIATPMNVTIMGVNVFNDNYDRGLKVVSEGVISVNSITANDNDSVAGVHGVSLMNTDTNGKAVTVSGTNVFNGNSGNGLLIESKGAITLNNITAMENTMSGAYIQNQTAEVTPQFVKMNGTNLFSGNTDVGLYVQSDGAITVNNLTASGNANGGALLDNNEGGATGLSTVTLTGTQFINDNTGGRGLYIFSIGAVTLGKLTADDNTTTAVEIATSGNVTLSCASITSNGGGGLDVSTIGSVTLKGVISSGNTGTDILSSVTPIIVRTCP